MSAPPYQKLFWGSYHKHTAHLRHAREHGAYLLLIGALWNNDGRLPADDDALAAYALLTTKEWLTIKPKLMPLFRVARGKLTQPRVTEDLAKYRDISGKRKEAGKTGGTASAGKRTKKPQANATRLPTKPEPESEDNPPIPPDGGASASGHFERAFAAFPQSGRASTSPAKARAAWDVEVGDTDPEKLVSAVVSFAASDFAKEGGGRRVPSFQRWLSERRYVAWLPASTPSAFLGPDDFRRAVIAEKGEGWARSWLDPCGWRDLPEKALVPRTATAAERLTRELRKTLADFGVIVAQREAA